MINLFPLFYKSFFELENLYKNQGLIPKPSILLFTRCVFGTLSTYYLF